MASNIIFPRNWELNGLEETPESAFFNRRQLMAGVGAMAAIGGITGFSPRFALAAEDPSAGLYPFKRNKKFTIDRDLTPEKVTSTYNNFYEFGSHKQIAKAAQSLPIRPWTLVVDGMVKKPMELGIDDLIARMPLEERLYRHRCVEAWSMTVPWSGFALKSLLSLVEPLSSAKYVRFETFLNKDVASGQRQSWYPWPYVEGLTIAEASNDLAFLVTGVYGKPLAKQFGAPLRLALPWKYGFKSIKSIVKISFVDKMPKSFWQRINGGEYGFYANVNPKVDHKRWSQASERVLHTNERVPTRLFNGYAKQVAHLYKGMENQPIWF